ncbi:flagellar basal body-associated FliL family protein [Citreicella sp. C3M06]|uniref:flagellar basal body-associated FliL family protein n=1 Tax=Citreicella sp. C3M06 TaxID=2841564 RepID=UPI001C08CD27|nr:flagellar basal body-associated FliL family protein [Citreicella sp. C3M06]MBU2959704.1 flagellar basal body-associated FliL family protein [Citreicella sp. C3M06]
MTDATVDAPNGEEDVKKSSNLPLIIGVILALVGGGGGFFAVSSGLLPFAGSTTQDHAPAEASEDGGHDATADSHASGGPGTTIGEVSFIELPQLVVSMGTASNMHHLRFQASLEVLPSSVAPVESLKPRVIDVLNNYLRALSPSDIEAPGALIKIRSQLLRRIQMVTGENRVRDLLILEFVLN